MTATQALDLWVQLSAPPTRTEDGVTDAEPVGIKLLMVEIRRELSKELNKMCSLTGVQPWRVVGVDPSGHQPPDRSGALRPADSLPGDRRGALPRV